MKMKHIYMIIKLYILLGFFVVNKNKFLHMAAMQIAFQDFLHFIVIAPAQTIPKKEQPAADINLFSTLFTNLNLLERIWKWLKESVISNRFHASPEEIRASVVSFLVYIAHCLEKMI
ncbi:hypothetical protein ACQKIW_31390 [Bacillus thuringiensis]|uniref:hypothetical protein n=1 Tax=Bacillus thuringiensis TaxID=1428 RepID=UPI003D0481B5